MNRMPDAQIVREFRAREDDDTGKAVQNFMDNYSAKCIINVHSIWPFEKTMIDRNLSHVMVVFNIYY